MDLPINKRNYKSEIKKIMWEIHDEIREINKKIDKYRSICNMAEALSDLENSNDSDSDSDNDKHRYMLIRLKNSDHKEIYRSLDRKIKDLDYRKSEIGRIHYVLSNHIE